MVFMYIRETQNPPDTIDFAAYEAAGITDIIKDGFGITRWGPDAIQSSINSFISLLDETNINIHLLCQSFQGEDRLIHYDQTQLELTSTSCARTLELFPEVKGISFNDYYFNSENHDPENVIEETQYLIDMADATREAMHDINPTSILSAPMNITELNGGDITAISPYLDLVIPMIYRYYDTSPNYVFDNLKTILTKTGNTPVAPGLMCYKDDSHTDYLHDDSLMERDMRACKALGCDYALFMHPYISNTLTIQTSCPIEMIGPGFFIYNFT